MEQDMSRDAEFRKLVGAADLCELMAAAFRFPEDAALATALVDGSFSSDLSACLQDAGLSASEAEGVAAPLEFFAGKDVAWVQEWMRRGFSLLFLQPGGKTPIWYYETAFCHRRDNRPGEPALFRSPIAVDVEEQMREAGVTMEDRLSSPPDSIWDELMFIAYLLGDAARQMYNGDSEEKTARFAQAQRFAESHLFPWVTDLFKDVSKKCSEESRPFGEMYKVLANIGTSAMAQMKNMF